MNGGLLKSASRIALVAVAGLLAGGVAAQAADLGGNCCADLEERVAELEATTARKGNRKVSLTVYGHVNESVIFWNDGVESNQYVVSNNGGAGRTRFGFKGDAKITSDLSAGYLLEIGVRYANSGNRNQDANFAGGNGNTLDIRHSAWYLDSKSLGRVWVGKSSGAADGITEINLANINSGNGEASAWNNGYFLRGTSATGVATKSALTWANINHQGMGANFAGEGDRINVVRYVSPTFAGFIASASWGEDDRVDAALRYAGEFSGFRLAAGIGYQKVTDFNATGDNNGGCDNTGGATVSNVDCSSIGMSGSVMHTATGLFVFGAYGQQTDKKLSGVKFTNATGQSITANDTNKTFVVQAGIEQKWFALGKSTVFGEYMKGDIGTQTSGGNLRAVGTEFGTLAGSLAGSNVKFYGIGFNQEITAAAADFYIHARQFSGGGDVLTSAGVKSFSAQDFKAVMTGMVIRF
jgi:predicted porin